LGTYWASDEGVERREYQQSDEWLEKCRASGFLAGATPTQTVVPPPTAATLATFALPAATAPLVPGLAPPLVAAPQMPLASVLERYEARAWQASFAPPPSPPREYVTIDRATVVPPEPGAPRRFVGVSWDLGKGLWKAEYKTAKATPGSRNRRTLGRYATEQIAARVRHKHICREGLEQFNTMDVLDDATGLMVPREKAAPPPSLQQVAPPPVAARPRGRVIEMRRVGDASWRRFNAQIDAAKASGLAQSEVSFLINDRSKASGKSLLYEARRVGSAASEPEKKPPKKRPREEPVAAAPTRQSSRVRKAVSKD